jgi:alpha-glucan phosphorylase-like protein
MEYAINDDSGSYAGGLGILAGDYLLEAADLNLPVIAIGLHYGKNISHEFVPLTQIEVPIGDENLKVRVWQKNFKNSVTLLLLDTDVEGNSNDARKITGRLYDSNFYTRLKQEMLLGIGGVRILKQFKITPKVYHLNEGHTAYAALAIKAEDRENEGKIVSTKHTIFSNAGSFIPRNEFDKYIKPYCLKFNLNPDQIFELGKFELNKDMFATTKFMISCSRISNGVSKLHTVYEKIVHPHSKLVPITNGVYKKRWRASEWGEKEVISDEEFWRIKNKLRKKLVSFVRERTGIIMNEESATAVWSRRFAAYKQPSLLFSDLDRLEKIVSNKEKPIQFVISGKAHPDDKIGLETIERIEKISKMPQFKGKVAYIPNYDIVIARHLVQGADIWINTPIRGKEACGTSGLKASLNGALQCSVSDGWVDEVDFKDKGWILSEDRTKDDLYRLLETEIPDLFYKKNEKGIPLELIQRMRASVLLINSNFTATRMIEDYVDKIY